MSNPKPVVSRHGANQYGAKPYVVGYVLSLALTLMAYVLVTQHHAGKTFLIVLVAGLALIQFLVQMFFFLHLNQKL